MRTLAICYVLFALASAPLLSIAQPLSAPPLPAPPEAPNNDRVREDALDGCANKYAESIYLDGGDPYDLGHDVIKRCKNEIDTVVAYRTAAYPESAKRAFELEKKLSAHRLASMQIQLLRAWHRGSSNGL